MFEVRSDKLRKRLLPRRGLPESARAQTARQQAASLRKLSQAFAKKENAFAAGLETQSQPELRALRASVHALVSALSVEAMEAAPVEVLAGAVVVLAGTHVDQTLAHVLVQARGLATAVEVYAIGSRYGLSSDGNWMRSMYLTEEAGRSIRPDLEPLRHAVCAADDAAYLEARAVAEGWRAKLEPRQRVRLSFVFPDEPWANEDVTECMAAGVDLWDWAPLLSAVSDPEVAAAAIAGPAASHLGGHAMDLAARLPEDRAVALLAEGLPPLLKKPSYGPLLKTPPRYVVDALSCFRTPAAAAALAPYIASSILGAQVAAYFRESPDLLPILKAHGGSKSARAVIESIQAGIEAASDAGDVAGHSDVPAVLRDRPWRPQKRPRVKATVLDVPLLADFEESIDPEFMSRTFPDHHAASARGMTPSEVEQWRQHARNGRHVHADYAWNRDRKSGDASYLRPPADEGLALWNRGQAGPGGDIRSFMQARGAAAIEGLTRMKWWTWLSYEEGPAFLEAAYAVRSPRMAPAFALVAEHRKKYRREAHHWLQDNARAACLGLIPQAVGADGSARKDAEQALFTLAQTGHAALVRQVAESYGSEVLEAMDRLLARDPLAIHCKPPKAPDFVRPAELPPLILKAGGKLPLDAVEAFLEMLRTVPRSPRYAGLAPVDEAITPESLDDFLCALFEGWVIAGGGGRHDWIAYAHARFEAPRTTRRVGEQLRTWATKSRANAERVADALAEGGSDQALLHLAHVRETSRFEALRRRSGDLLAMVARQRGLSIDELEDRTVPDLGLDAAGGLSLSFGERNFRVTLDEALHLTIRDADGAVHRTLPRGRKTDDADKTKQAKKRFAAFKKDVAAIAVRLQRRLELAMVNERTWPVAQFTEFVVSHPLVSHVARGLVWEVADGPCFRVAEDGSFADVQDEEFLLPTEGGVRIAHPLALGDDLPLWSELFSDYERVQPFEQLGRQIFTPTEKERTSDVLERHVGGSIEAAKLIGILESRGWRRDHGGHVSAWLKNVRGAEGVVEVRLPVSPGFEIAYLKDASLQTPGGAEVGTALGELGRVGFSELVRDLVLVGVDAS